MDSTATTKTVSEETCAHDWKMEPAWRMVSHGRCQKCKASTTVLNNPEREEPVKRRSLRRNKRSGGSRKPEDVTPSESCSSKD